MTTDYLYCLDQDTCIHRYGCLRWVGNYSEDEVIEESTINLHGYVDTTHCIPNLSDISCTNCYDLLDRFRDSTERGEVEWKK